MFMIHDYFIPLKAKASFFYSEKIHVSRGYMIKICLIGIKVY